MRCKCIDGVNAELKKHGQTLDLVYSGIATKTPRVYVRIATRSTEKATRRKPKTVTGGYCPFCGKRHT